MGKKRKKNKGKNKTNADNRDKNKSITTAPTPKESEDTSPKPTSNKGYYIGAAGVIIAAIITATVKSSGHSEKIQADHGSVAAGGGAAVATGSGSAVAVTASTNVTLNLGVTDQTVAMLQKQMETEAKEREKELDSYFPGGYIMFTATKKETIVPFNRAPLPDFYVDNWQDCKIVYDEQTTGIQLPGIIWRDNYVGKFHAFFENPVKVGATAGLLRVEENLGIRIYVVNTNKDTLTFAFGMHPS